MAAQLLDGRILSAQVEQSIKTRVEALAQKGCVPGLTVILVGDDPASQTYVSNKEKACARLGIRSRTLRMPKDISQETLEKAILEANEDPAVHGILVQLPLPKHLDESRALALILPQKDVDGFHDVNMGRLARGEECVVACTPKGALYMLKSAGIPLEGKEAVVVGRSNIVGKPMALLLLQENATVTICHSRTRDLAAQTRRADILVAAIGKPRFITADMVKPGAVVVDVGINRVDGKLCGDVDFDAVSQVASFITPVPGGVGKMTIAMLMDNTVSAAERAARQA
ncbi:MAG TPA: bifunctional methylenetetrahydrofolate dehydrogenase/methenyltetrahydrofolate cyclohydrolase FolD [Candidatus Limiplasma stercoravium]|nr:bifunctional methylenetetrahydrofolate dehydrogenase/methenyltetrahydrofolate cyclohydrolase FolD [Candidatus Limiplasma stercoravium]